MADEPIPEVHAPALVVKPPEPEAERTDKPKSPTTTIAEDKTVEGQRRINLIWETQQALIASFVVGTTLFVTAKISLLILNIETTEQQSAMVVTSFLLLSNIVNLVIGFYFGRTNHTKVGGVDSKNSER